MGVLPSVPQSPQVLDENTPTFLPAVSQTVESSVGRTPDKQISGQVTAVQLSEDRLWQVPHLVCGHCCLSRHPPGQERIDLVLCSAFFHF